MLNYSSLFIFYADFKGALHMFTFWQIEEIYFSHPVRHFLVQGVHASLNPLIQNEDLTLFFKKGSWP